MDESRWKRCSNDCQAFHIFWLGGALAKYSFITQFFLGKCTTWSFSYISDNQAKNQQSVNENSKLSGANKTHHHKHGLNTKQRTFLMEELALLNATGAKKTFLNSRRRNSSKDFVVFMSTSDSAVEVNKAPQEQKNTEGGVVATSGLHYHDQYSDR